MPIAPDADSALPAGPWPESARAHVPMAPASRSRVVLVAGLALGSTWYAVGEHVPFRLNVAAAFAALLLVLHVLERARLTQVPRDDRLVLGGASVLLLAAFVGRDSVILGPVNALALAGLIALRGPGTSLSARLIDSGWMDLAARLVRAGVGVVAGAIGALASLEVGGRGWVPQWRFGLGVVAVSPLLVVFALLLSSADPLLGRLLTSLISVEPGPVLERAIPILACSWVATGLLWALSRRSAPGTMDRTGVKLEPGPLPAAMVTSGLAALAGLFSLFLLLQARFLVGGRDFVLGSADLTFAEYARRGFFELVVVIALMLPVLLGGDWLADQRAPSDRRGIQRVVRLLLVLLGGLVASAMMRMVVYSAEFGLTELRVYTTAFMAWLGFVLAWFGATVLRGRRSRLAPGALGGALLVLVALNLLNPAAWIVRYNVARASGGRPLDARHIAELGGGAVPAAIAALGRLQPADRCALALALHERWVVKGSARAQWSIEGSLARGRAPEIVAARTACTEGAGADRDS